MSEANPATQTKHQTESYHWVTLANGHFLNVAVTKHRERDRKGWLDKSLAGV